MPESDREVFSYLVADPDRSYEINLLTYALFADERAKWVEHHLQQNGVEPDEASIRHWTRNLTDQQFEHMRFRAARFFDDAARLYLQSDMEAEKRKVLESEILVRVTAAGSFWRQMAMSLLTAVLAPLVIGGGIAAVLAYNKVFPAFVQVPTEVNVKRSE